MMKISQLYKRQFDQDPDQLNSILQSKPQLVLIFWSMPIEDITPFLRSLQQSMPNTSVVGCSSSGDILDREVLDNGWVLTALCFENPDSKLITVTQPLLHSGDSDLVGMQLAKELHAENLQGVMILAPGVGLDGGLLVHGLRQHLPRNTPVSGGMAGDNGKFISSEVLTPTGIASDHVIAIGFYGEGLSYALASVGGWRPFGPKRKITAARGNVLFEIDEQPALTLYKKYLGRFAQDLPSSGLLFPLEMMDDHFQSTGIIRTILGVDEEQKSILLAGSIRPNGYVRFMLASPDMLVAGAEQATQEAQSRSHYPPEFALCVSCVGRKMVLGQRVYEEASAVSDALNNTTAIAGFYSNGEFGPNGNNEQGYLHNQTMSITLLSEWRA